MQYELIAIPLASCVPMLEQKITTTKNNDENGYFFQAEQCAVLSLFRVGNCFFFLQVCENAVIGGAEIKPASPGTWS